MAYHLAGNAVIAPDHSIIEIWLACYDTLDDDDFEWDRDELLRNRSAFELVRESLSDAQRAELDTVDAHWRANAAAFNRAFGTEHHQHDRKTALTGFVTDARGKVPAVPADHWWWKPIEDPAK